MRAFNAPVAPNAIGGAPWVDVMLTRAEVAARKRLRTGPQVPLDLDEGVITSMNKLTPKKAPLMQAAALAHVGGADSRPGIQLLTPAEVNQLGRLNAAEKATLRTWLNTKDLFPYAVVPDQDANKVIYLAKPEGLTGDPEQIVRTTPFPAGLPAIEAHLTRFRPVLESTTLGWGERRPWWTLHRPRAHILQDATADSTGWAKFCLTGRWGNGGRLLVALAPANTTPASGLHAIRAADDSVPAAYLTALYNSHLYQEIADTLPPGQLRKNDLQRLGLPYRADDVLTIAGTATTLADIVTNMITTLAPRFPLLGDALRADLTLAELPVDAWVPIAGPSTAWGPLSRLSWVHDIAKHRAASTRLGDVTITPQTLFGPQIDVAVRGDTTRRAVTLTLDAAADPGLADVVADRLRGLGDTGGTNRDIDTIQMPTSAAAALTTYRRDVSELETTATAYRQARQVIDDLLVDH